MSDSEIDSVRWLDVRLNAPVILQFHRPGYILAKIAENLGFFPFPAFDVAVGEGKIAALAMPVGRQVPPLSIRIGRARPRNAEQRIKDASFMHINEHEQIRRLWFVYLCELS